MYYLKEKNEIFTQVLGESISRQIAADLCAKIVFCGFFAV